MISLRQQNTAGKKIKTLAGSDYRGYKTTDQIYKGFMLYKSGKAPAEFTAQKELVSFQGSLDEVKRNIDKYWEKKDAEVVLGKRKNVR